MRKILLGVTGSIAAYKAVELVRLFVKNGDAVTVIMTPAACEFVKPLTFQTLSRNPVYVDPFAPRSRGSPSTSRLRRAPISSSSPRRRRTRSRRCGTALRTTC